MLCCTGAGEAVQLTVDHTPYDDYERQRIEDAGVAVSKEGVWRVEGVLAVTRSIGDKVMNAISAYPDLLFLRLNDESSYSDATFTGDETTNACVNLVSLREGRPVQFLIVASDGLWDVLSNDEAVQITCDYLYSQMIQLDSFRVTIELPSEALHYASQILAREAFVRGSSDNIGVCVIDLGSGPPQLLSIKASSKD